MNKNEFKACSSDSKGNIAGFEYISSAVYEEKKSKFYSYIFNITDINNANEIINNMKKYFKDARHVVYAYVLENEYYFSDDGEPSGTGGKAIYSLLEKQKVINTLVIVVRYFGGILLGVGPLSRAYTKAVKMAEENLNIIPYIKNVSVNVICEYNEEPSVRKLIEKVDAKIHDVKYDKKAIYTINIKEEDIKLFNKYIIN